MQISMFPFGKTKNGEEVFGYELKNANGYSLKAINYGATLISFLAPDKEGNIEEIQLGFDNIGNYEEYSPYFGSTIGRFGNRIKDGKFILGDQTFQLAKNNNGANHLHGGVKGFDKVIWDIKSYVSNGDGIIEFSYVSKDGEEGYPGELSVVVTYLLSSDNEFIINYAAHTTKDTPVNLTNHTYWNLTGNKKSNILNHQIEIHCDSYLPVDDSLIPTGEIKPVAETVMDFTEKRRIGRHIDAAGGYDHCYIRSDKSGNLIRIAQVYEPESGRTMEIATTEPAVQFYTGNFLDDIDSLGFHKHEGFCLETQHFPDSVNQPHFPSTILKPGQTYHQETVHRFSVQ